MLTFAEYNPAARPLELNANVRVAGELEVMVAAAGETVSQFVAALEVYEMLAE
jgi:hypothetical protein